MRSGVQEVPLQVLRHVSKHRHRQHVQSRGQGPLHGNDRAGLQELPRRPETGLLLSRQKQEQKQKTEESGAGRRRIITLVAHNIKITMFILNRIEIYIGPTAKFKTFVMSCIIA